MQVLIVEDNVFNAFCLSRIFEVTYKQVQVTVANKSHTAMKQFEKISPALVILDGDLGADKGRSWNGPALADILWEKYPHVPVVAWTDCEQMRSNFADVFKRHNKAINEYNNWAKVVCPIHIHQSIAYLTAEFNYSTTPPLSIAQHFYA